MYNDIKRYESWLINHSIYKDSSPFQRIDYSYKAKLLDDSSLLKESSHLSYMSYVSSRGVYKDNELMAYEFFDYDSALSSIIDRVGVCAYLESLRINNSKYHRQKRLHERINKIIINKSYFLTLTFRNEYLYIPSMKYIPLKKLRTIVSRYLKANFTDYVANVDYGSKNGRLHFHAVASCDYVNPCLWPYGNLDFEVIYGNNDNKLGKYVDKLTMHAIKETTRRNHLIYCRKSKPKKMLDLGWRSMLYCNCEYFP